MAELQKTFRGLSGFIGLFRGGNVGMDFNRQIQPVLEMEDWLAPNDFIIQTFSLAAVGDRASSPVPEDEFWRLKWGSVFVDNSAATSTVYLNKEVDAGGASFNIPLTPPNMGTSTLLNQTSPPTTEGGFGVDLRPHNMQPGERVGVQLFSLPGGGPVTGHFFYQFQRIKV